MRSSSLLLTSLLILTTPVAFAAEGTFDKTLSVSSAPNVSVVNGSGYVHVYSGADTQIHIVGHVHASAGWLGGDAEARVKQIVAAPPIVQSGNTITVGDRGDSSLFQNVSVDYDITTPRSTVLKAQTGSGELEIGGIATAVTAQTGSGELKAENVGGNSRFDTGSGAIRIGGINGALHVRSGSGRIEITGVPSGDWDLGSGSGSIHAKLSDNARFNLSAETGSGTIRVDEPIVMQGAMNRHRVTGSVNGGGSTVHASTGSGDIVLGTGPLVGINSLHVPGATDCVDNPSQAGCRRN